MNHLQHEQSPYLLQHADNPVDWFPWGEGALEKARRENKPIFISIGYSTCHWCHVMAHESFEDKAIAEKLNRDFVAIKVDREERPDLDATYMQACQLMNGHGGWPLNLFLCPNGKPFYALTYLPPYRSGRHPGFGDVIEKIAQLWKEQPDHLVEAGNRLADAILEQENASAAVEPEEAILEAAIGQFKDVYDHEHGGFGRAPKFPQPHNAALLLRLGQRFKDPESLQMALKTLRKIAAGGITDQLGGGLHRYSVDNYWLVPHFEKMLYDQALISSAYLDAWQFTGQACFQKAAETILDYCLTELKHHDGGFYCGEDADSEGAEGTFYLWSYHELIDLLSEDEAKLVSHYYNVSERGSFEGKNILHITRDLAVTAEELGLSPARAGQILDQARQKLRTFRRQRPRPHLDDKILTGWNGLMIASMARAGQYFGNDDYLHAALEAADFICSRMMSGGRLLRRHRNQDSAIPAFHEDYAFFIHGLIDLFLATSSPKHLDLALALQRRCDQLFNDDSGGYFDSEQPFLPGMGRGRSRQDGAIPAASSVTAHNLIRLARITASPDVELRARTLLKRQLSHAARYPTAFAFSLLALDLLLAEKMSLVIVTVPKGSRLPAPWTAPILSFRPAMITVVTSHPEKLADRTALVGDKRPVDGKTTAWLCTGSSCLEPVTEPEALQKLLEAHAPLNTFSK